jgi:hypothetical protein
MKKTLLATVAAAAVVGFTTLAAAQAPTEGESGKATAKPQGAQQQPKAAPGGAMSRQQGGAAQTNQKTPGPPSSQSAQGEGAKTGGKTDEGMSQDRPVQDQNQATPQRGAQEGSEKSGVNASEQRAGQSQSSPGKSVQLSQDQRTKIRGAIGNGHGARVTGNVNFEMTVGATVPRSVHIEVLPEDIVTIVPEYRGFDYVLVGDEILIIDPHTMEIVAVIPA